MNTLLASLDELPEQVFAELPPARCIRSPGNIFANCSGDHSFHVRTDFGLNSSELLLGQGSRSHLHRVARLILRLPCSNSSSDFGRHHEKISLRFIPRPAKLLDGVHESQEIEF